MKRATFLMIALAITTIGWAQAQENHAVLAARTMQGLYKAAAVDNSEKTPGIDCKFKFMPNGTFQFTQKTMTATVVTIGTYTLGDTTVELRPAPTHANWPHFWGAKTTLTIGDGGDLKLGDLDYTPSLIGKEFEPGWYKCESSPAIHYFFDRNGGYKYTGQGTSTGEYWVAKETDPTTNTDKVYLVVNILRVDGKRVNFHQRIDIVDGGFVMEGKFKYHHTDTKPR